MSEVLSKLFASIQQQLATKMPSMSGIVQYIMDLLPP